MGLCPPQSFSDIIHSMKTILFALALLSLPSFAFTSGDCINRISRGETSYWSYWYRVVSENSTTITATHAVFEVTKVLPKSIGFELVDCPTNAEKNAIKDKLKSIKSGPFVLEN